MENLTLSQYLVTRPAHGRQSLTLTRGHRWRAGQGWWPGLGGGCGRNLGRDGADLDTRTRHFVTGVFVVVIFNRNVGQTDTAGVALVKLQSVVRAVQCIVYSG